jgi:hypothetical protein
MKCPWAIVQKDIARYKTKGYGARGMWLDPAVWSIAPRLKSHLMCAERVVAVGHGDAVGCVVKKLEDRMHDELEVNCASQTPDLWPLVYAHSGGSCRTISCAPREFDPSARRLFS